MVFMELWYVLQIFFCLKLLPGLQANFVKLCVFMSMLEVFTRFEQRGELWFCPRLSLKGQEFYVLFWSDW